MQGGYDQGPYGPRPHERRYSGGPAPPAHMMVGPSPSHMAGPAPPPGYFGTPPLGPRRRSRSPGLYRGGYQGPPSNAPYPPSHAPPPKLTDPFTIKELVTFEYFKRWYHTLNPGNLDADEMTIRTRFDDYVADFNVRMAKDFVKEQETFPWFTEMYGGPLAEGADVFEARFACGPVPASAQEEAYAEFQAKLDSGEHRQQDSTATSDQPPLYLDRSPTGPPDLGDPLPGVAFVKVIEPKVPRSELQAFIAPQVSLEYLSMSRPNTKFLRSAWVKLQEGSEVDEAVKKLDGRILLNDRVGEFAIRVQPYQPFTARMYLFPQQNELTQANQDLEHLEELVKKFESQVSRASLWPRIQESFDGIDALSTEQKLVKTVDLAVQYLREVFCFDYWTASFHDSRYSLSHYAPGYVRSKESVEAVDERRFKAWARSHAEKLSMLLQPLEYLEQLKVKPFEGALRDAIGAKIKKEDETRFRCGIENCAKLFKDVPFVEKHINKRHADWVETQKLHLLLLYRYLCDPAKLVHPRTMMAEPRRPDAPRGPASAERRRSPPGYRREPAGYYDTQRGPPGPPRVYRDLDRPAEPVVELDY